MVFELTGSARLRSSGDLQWAFEKQYRPWALIFSEGAKVTLRQRPNPSETFQELEASAKEADLNAIRPTSRVCFVHVGTHKTGTTSIQRFLALNRDRFARAGVLFPKAGCANLPDYVSHHQLAYELTGSPLFEPRYGGLEALAAELRDSGASTACISSENFSHLWQDHVGLARLRDTIVQAGFTPKVVCYLRPQASICTSAYAQIVCNGGYRTPFSNYLKQTLTRDGFGWISRVGIPFDYERLLDPFAEVFGRDSVIVSRYRSSAPDKTLLSEFARLLLGTDDVAAFAIPPARENGSLDFNTVLSFLGHPRPAGVGIRFAPLRVREVVRFGLRFRRSNAGVARRYAVRLPAFEALDIALASPFRRTLAKTWELGSARRALMLCGTQNARCASASREPVMAPPIAQRARPILLECLIALTAAGVASTALLYGTRIASTALVEFGILSAIVTVCAMALLVRHTVDSPGKDAAYRFIDDLRVRSSVVGYALLGVYALVNASLDVGLARHTPDVISYPGTLAVAAAALIATAARPLRKRLLGEVSGGSILATLADDRAYVACCYVALFAQIIHAAVTDWWMDTALDVLVVVFVAFRLAEMWRSSHVSSPHAAA